jgi:poly-gamma-glutamate synthesis protein (capsule biosynthesis protein)
MGRRSSQITVVLRKVIFPLVLLLLFVGIAFRVYSIKKFDTTNQFTQQQTGQEAEANPIIHSSHFYSKDPFEDVSADNTAGTVPENTEVLGGIIPHHMLAAPLIASFFKGIENREVQTIVLLGPDHGNIAEYPISISQAQWDTPYGIIQPNRSLSSYLLETSIAGIDEKVFETEHSIFNITPFIKKTFPQAEILPVTFNGGVNQSEAESLAQALAERLTEKSVVIAAVDFSHDVTPKKAQEQDRRSLEMITTFSLNQIYTLETDSNPSIYTLLSYLEKKDANITLILGNSNSSEIAQIPTSTNVTSYVSVYFVKKELTNPALSLDAIFNHERSRIRPSDEGTLTVAVTGDVNLGRGVNAQLKRGGDSNKLFEHIGDLLRSADVALINLESPLINDCPLTFEGMMICGNTGNAKALRIAGIDIASLANNHAEDYGQNGIQQTEKELSENGIEPLSQGQMVLKTVNGIKIAVLTYDTVWHSVNEQTVKFDLVKAGTRADIVMVLFHWGNEYTAEPTGEQTEFAHLAIDNGADLVVGNHPHWVQAIELYKNTLIVYSHGNLVFDQLWSEETREGVLGRYTFSKEGLQEVEFVPIWINDGFQPIVAEDLRAQKTLNRMRQVSEQVLK